MEFKFCPNEKNHGKFCPKNTTEGCFGMFNSPPTDARRLRPRPAVGEGRSLVLR